MKQEYKLDILNIRNQIKSLTVMRGLTLTQLKNLVNEKYQKTDSLDNLTKKLRKKTVKATELNEILDVLGYELIIKDKNDI